MNDELLDRAMRRQQLALAWMLLLLGTAAPLLDAASLWPVAAVGAVVSGMLLWGALGHESIASPVVGIIATSVPFMFATDRPAVGSLAGVVLAMALGEHLATVRHSRYVTPGISGRWAGSSSVLVHGGAAAGAATITMLLTVLPEFRVWSSTAVVFLGLAAVALQRRRTAMRVVALPPPQRLGE